MSGIWQDDSKFADSRILPARISRGPRTGFAENMGAVWDATGKAELGEVSEATNQIDAYDPIIAALNEDRARRRAEAGPIKGFDRRGLTPRFVNPYGPSPSSPAALRIWGDADRRDAEVARIWAEVARIRAENPAALPGLPAAREDFEAAIRADVEASLSQAADVGDRSTAMGTIGGLVGGMGRAMTHPANQATIVIGAPGSAGILRTALTEGVVNAGIEGALQPDVARYRRALGLGYTAEDFIRNVGFAAGGGFLLGGAIKGGIRGVQAGIDAGRLGREKLVEAFRRDVPNPTAEQRGALYAAEREIEADKVIPVEKPAPAARGEHRQRLNEALAAADEGRLPDIPDRPGHDGPPPAGPADNLDGVVHAFDPAELKVDAHTFQFKTGADDAGVTDRLAGVKKWDPVKAGQVVVYEFEAGGRFIADGHQRLALAQRLAGQGQNVRLYGHLLREADGVTPAEARAIAAAKNIAEGTGTAVDAAKLLRVAPERLAELPPNSALVRHASDMTNLSDDAFMMAVNEIVPEHFAAIVGRLAAERPELHAQILAILKKADPDNAAQAESITREVLGAGAVTERQVSLFGEADETVSLYADRARVLDRALKQLRRDRAVFNTLVGDAGRIEAAGNRLVANVNQTRANKDGEAIETLSRLAHRKGPLSDALTQAAGRAREGDSRAAVDGFVEFVRHAADSGDLARMVDGAGGRDVEAPRQARASEPDPETERLEDFAEPAGKGQADQAAALETEIRRELAIDIPGVGERLLDDTAVHPSTGESLIDALERAQAMPATVLIETPERVTLRQEIAGEIYGAGAAAKERIAHIVMGPSAAGKSSALAEPLAAREGALIIDSDMAKERLPEFDGGIGAHAVHEESVQIMEGEGMVLDRALDAGDNIVMPIVGKTLAGVEDKVALFREAGYSVRVALVDLPIEKAVDRAIARFQETGRLVDPRYVAEIGSLPLENYTYIKGRGDIDGYQHYSNDVAQGSPPRLLEAGGTETPGGSRGSLDGGDPQAAGRAPGPQVQRQGDQDLTPPTERTDAGDQTVVPGAERISDRALAERRGAEPLRPRVAQQPPDEGLFDVGGRGQGDLLDELEVPVGERVDDQGNVLAEARTVREILDEHAGDDEFLDNLDTICGPKGAGS